MQSLSIAPGSTSAQNASVFSPSVPAQTAPVYSPSVPAQAASGFGLSVPVQTSVVNAQNMMPYVQPPVYFQQPTVYVQPPSLGLSANAANGIAYVPSPSSLTSSADNGAAAGQGQGEN